MLTREIIAEVLRDFANEIDPDSGLSDEEVGFIDNDVPNLFYSLKEALNDRK